MGCGSRLIGGLQTDRQPSRWAAQRQSHVATRPGLPHDTDVDQ